MSTFCHRGSLEIFVSNLIEIDELQLNSIAYSEFLVLYISLFHTRVRYLDAFYFCFYCNFLFCAETQTAYLLHVCVLKGRGGARPPWSAIARCSCSPQHVSFFPPAVGAGSDSTTRRRHPLHAANVLH